MLLRIEKGVWFIFTDIFDWGGWEEGMQQFYVDYLNIFGSIIDSSLAVRAKAYLYNLISWYKKRISSIENMGLFNWQDPLPSGE